MYIISNNTYWKKPDPVSEPAHSEVWALVTFRPLVLCGPSLFYKILFSYKNAYAFYMSKKTRHTWLVLFVRKSIEFLKKRNLLSHSWCESKSANQAGPEGLHCPIKYFAIPPPPSMKITQIYLYIAYILIRQIRAKKAGLYGLYFQIFDKKRHVLFSKLEKKEFSEKKSTKKKQKIFFI